MINLHDKQGGSLVGAPINTITNLSIFTDLIDVFHTTVSMQNYFFLPCPKDRLCYKYHLAILPKTVGTGCAFIQHHTGLLFPWHNPQALTIDILDVMDVIILKNLGKMYC